MSQNDSGARPDAPAADVASPQTLHVGARAMPPWNVAELPDAPTFETSQILAMIGQALSQAVRRLAAANG